ASALGGSRVQIGGPTGAFVVIVYAIVQRHGVEGLAAATMMAGVILVIFGVVRLGGAIKFIPYPVTIGFTSGIALIIFSSQVKDFLGLRMGAVPADFVGKWHAIGAHLDTIDPWALLVGLTALAIIVGWPLVNRRVPSPFVALIATTAMVQLLHFPVETIGSRFGAINAALPAPALPAVTPQQLPGLLAPAFTIALLGAIESLLSAVVADGMIGGRHRSNMELVAQGVANIVAPLFGGIPAPGAIARPATTVTHEFHAPVDDFETDPNAVRRRVVPPGVEVFEITGPFFFGAAETLRDRLGAIAAHPKVLIVRLRHVPAIDSTGLHALRELVKRSRREGTLMLLSDVHAQPVVALERSGLYDEVGEENVHGNIDDALNR